MRGPPKTCSQYLRDQHGGRSRRARRLHDRRRTRPRRAWRLARLRPVAARRTHSRAVGDGRGRQDPRGDRHRRRDAVGRRWVRGAVSGCRSAARPAAAAAGSRTKSQALVVRQLGATALFAAKFRENAAPVAPSAEAPARACARRSGSSASARPICWRSRRATDRFRCCSRRIASVCATSSTCRRSSPRCRMFEAARSASRRSTPSGRRRLPPRCSSAMSRASSTTAMRRWPSGARRRSSVDQAQLRELHRRCGAARTARRRRHGRDRAPASAARSRGSRHEAPTASTTCCSHRRPQRSRRSRRDGRAKRGRAASALLHGAARASSVRIAGETRYHRCRGCLALPRRARHAAATRRARIAARAGSRSARRSRAALRADARAVHGGRLRRRGTAWLEAAAEEVLIRLTARVGCSKASSGPAARDASGLTRACFGMLRRRSLARLRREVEPVDQAGARAASRRPGKASSRRRRGADALLDAIEQLQGRPSGVDPRNRDPAGADSTSTILPISTRSSRQAKSSGWASSRLATAMAGSRSTWRTTCRSSCLRAGLRSSDLPNASLAILESPPIRRCVILWRAPRSRRRRLSRRDRRCPLAARVATASSPTTRFTPCARSRSPDPRRRQKRTAAATAFRSRRLVPPLSRRAMVACAGP